MDLIIENPLEIFNIELEIKDINDNAPRFRREIIQLDIFESASPGKRFSLSNAADPDVGVNSVKTYRLSQSEYFTIDIQTGRDGSKFADLVLKKALDREEQAVHNLILTAIDGGVPAQSGTASITVRVLDTNDNAPQFDQQMYTVNITENSPIGTLVIKLNATDLDFGSNAEIVYSFSPYTPDKTQETFILNSVSGEIRVKEMIDFEEIKMFEIHVIATDKGANSMSGDCKLIIFITDMNDNYPEISLKSFKSPIKENVTVDTVIALISVSDTDSGENGKVDLQLSQLLPFALQKSSENYYALVVSETLDREKVPEFNITFIVRDRGSPPLSNNKTITLELLDVNDNPPLFPKSFYTISVMENNAPGSMIHSVTAVDPDLNENRYLVPYTPDKTQETFILNSVSGEIRVKEMIDFEEIKMFEIHVIATDKGHTSLSGDCKLIIFITDMNDNYPEISIKSFKSPIKENVTVDTVIALISVSDTDSGENGKVDLQLSQLLPFALQKSSENYYALVVSETLDREKVPEFNITFIVRDRGSPPLSNNKTITLELLDVNDNPPLFPKSFYTISVMENNAPGSMLHPVTAVDPDLNENRYLVYSIIEKDIQNISMSMYFSINPENGKLYALQTFDFEKEKEFLFHVEAKDSGVPPLSSNVTVHILILDQNDNTPVIVSPCKSAHCYVNLKAVIENPLEMHHVTVEIMDVNDHSPSFPDNAYRLEIPESAATGARFQLEGAHDPDVGLNALRLYKLSQNEHFQLEIDDLSDDMKIPVLVLHKPLDRERIPVHNLLLTAFDGGNPQRSGTLNITIIVLDVNDNAPVFDQQKYSVTIQENVAIGTFLIRVNATDLDEDVGLNALRLYKLTPNEHFELDVVNLSEYNKIPFLVLQKPLDRERIPVYNLLLAAFDGGKPQKSSTLNITVIVLDINDNAPVFDQPTYSVTLKENSPVGTFVIRLNASDLDEGVNGQVEYSFGNTFRSRVSELFHLDGKTGEIRVKGLIDFEEEQVYEINVQASDKGTTPFTTHCNVFVKIEDVNDNRPEIEVTSVSSVIPEDAQLGTVIALVGLTDLDSGPNGQIVCTLSENMPFDLKPSSEEHFYSLVTKRKLDRESTPLYNITITAHDLGKPSLSSFKTVSVELSDVNDNRPKFSQEPYTLYLLENNPPGASIFSVSTSDADENENALVCYALGNDLMDRTVTSFLNINSENGNIYALKSFDFEELKNFQFQVIAKDAGMPSLSSNVTVNVFIIDQNDNAPIILFPLSENGSAEAVEKIPKNANSGYLVSKVRAYDADIGYNAWLSFSLQQVTDSSLFGLDRYTGQIRTLRPIMETDGSEHKLTIQVKDNGNASFSATATIYVTTYENTESFAVSDINNAAKSAFVGNVARDLGFNIGKLKDRGFRVVSVSKEQLFQVNQNDGTLLVNGNIDREELCHKNSKCFINLKAVVENPLEMHHVEVEILDINDHNPSFPEKHKRLEISESTLPGTRFHLESAHDPDVGVNSVRLYRLSQSDCFKLEVKDRGEENKIPILILQTPLDREKVREHNLSLIAFDGGTPERSGILNITVIVLDNNDNTPAFDQEIYSVHLQENVAIGTFVIQVNATDPDEGSNGEVLYSFGRSSRSAVYDAFDLDVNTGKISVKGLIDFEQKQNYEIDIQASDKGQVPFTVHCTVFVKIEDLNDNAPEIDVTSLSNVIPEDARPGTVIALIGVADLDSGVNGQVVCRISANLPFELKPSSGEKFYSLVIKRSLDREATSVYNITIIGKDLGTPSLSSFKTITVLVSDINDNCPEFSQNPYSVYILENNVPGASIFSVSAMDADQNENAVVSYMLGNTVADITMTSFLNINPENGNIYALKSFDFETLKSFTFQVIAKDSGAPPLSINRSGILNITVTVLDMNDNAPVFDKDTYAVSLHENVQMGTFVIKVHASDLDDGPNAEITYSFGKSKKGKVTDVFQLDANTGEINVKGAIDFEESEAYEIDVQATDRGQFPVPGHCTVVVTIKDLNDNRPQIEVTSLSGVISENSNPGTVIAFLSVTDLDSGSNGQVECSLLGDVPFELKPSFQESVYSLVTKSRLDRESISQYNVTVVAKDNGQPSLYSLKTIHVQLSDVNDNSPRFLEDPYSFYLSENNVPGSSVFSLSANDIDENENAHVSYRLLDSGVHNEHFELEVQGRSDNKIPILILRKHLDREKSPEHNVLLTALDGGSPARSGILNITVTVLDINDNAPVFEQPTYTVTLDENVPVGTFVIQVKASDTDHGPNGQVEYSFGNTFGNKVLELFSLDSKTGIIKVNGTVDYEENDVYEIDVQATDKVLENPLEIHYVEVEITDINDNSPVFPEKEKLLEIAESTLPGARFQLHGARDADVGLNSLRLYKLSHNEHFELEVQGRSDNKIPILILRKHLDREKSPEHNVLLTALDGGSPARSGILNITVTVLDINDNAPVFEQPTYTVTLDENVPVGTFVIQVKASDTDHGPNGQVEYSFGNTFGNKVLELFSLDSKTGIIKVNGTVDYEENDVYEIDVQATDKGQFPFTVHCNVLVQIRDVNDNEPAIEITSLSITLDENVPVGTFVIQVKASDTDHGPNGQVEYSFGNTFGNKVLELFSLDSKTGIIKVNGTVDYEENDVYEIDVQATDKGQFPFTVHCNVLVQIRDVNDNEPAIEITSLSSLIPEDASPGTVIALISVTDGDSGSNGQVVCSLPENMPFDLKPSFRDDLYSLITKGHLDRELISTYNLSITAKDNGTPPLSSFKSITVQITDVNDNSPQFTQDQYTLYLPENNVPGASIFSVSAVDRDQHENALVSYYMGGRAVDSNSVSSFLNINSENGNIYALRSFDFESLKSFSFQVAARDAAFDGGNPRRSGTLNISIVVLDINDNSPVFDKEIYTVSLKENVPVGTFVIKLNATDLDEGPNGDIIYAFGNNIRSKVYDIFSLDASTGEITVKGLMDFEESEIYEIDVQASDKGPVPFNVHCSVVVKIEDVNDNTPEIDVTSLSSLIPEDSSPGTVIALISVLDIDSNSNGQVVCSLSENTPFELKSSFQNNLYSLVTKGHLDRERISFYNISIFAKDCGEPSLSSFKTIHVQISDVNDNSPSFSQNPYTFYLYENNAPGASVFSVTASDLDQNENARVSYEIPKGEGAGTETFLNINYENVLKKALDRELSTEHKLVLTAIDGGNPQKSGSLNITIVVLDVNDNRPIFNQDIYTVALFENVPFGTVVTKVNATDLDEGPNGEVVYSFGNNIKSKMYELFNLDANTGEITVKGGIDFEERDVYEINVQASDKGQVPMTVDCSVVVKIKDVNDNAPDIEITSLSGVIAEDASVGTVIALISVTDLDSGDNGQVFCTVSESVPFQLKSSFQDNLFSLVTKSRLDRETTSQYNITLIAQDRGQPSLSSEKTIHVSISDVNDNRPVFSQSSYTLYLTENNPPGMAVFSVSASDPDQNENAVVSYYIFKENLPFELKPSFQENLYSLVTKSRLDREMVSQYNITITANDNGQPSLSSLKTITIQISDINDNSPVFARNPYSFYLDENNVPGTSIFSVSASDRDQNENALVSYHIWKGDRTDDSVVSYLNINSENGNIYALKSFDFETLKNFQFQVIAKDSGEPSLSGNVTVQVFILDQNDNAPVILSPLSTNGSAEAVEEIPRNVNAGYLVTKVRAYDADIGYNAWLSFSLQQITDPTLFSLERHTGEIRTLRQITETDTTEHTLIIQVKDNGNISLSTTATVLISIVENTESFAVSDLKHAGKLQEENNLTFYLMVTLGSVSALFVISIIVLVVIQCSRPRAYSSKHSRDPNYADVSGNGTLCHSIQYRAGEKRYMLVGPRMSIGSTIGLGSNGNTLVVPENGRKASGEVSRCCTLYCYGF
ncbi:FAT4 protein, partial [Amia calva]|nr:FAT4 protein [Amia calva]